MVNLRKILVWSIIAAIGMIVGLHPDVTKLVWKFNRWHHQVDYSQFKNNLLVKRKGLEIPDTINNYGMKLIERSK